MLIVVIFVLMMIDIIYFYNIDFDENFIWVSVIKDLLKLIKI